jgi:hypothetical protein
VSRVEVCHEQELVFILIKNERGMTVTSAVARIYCDLQWKNSVCLVSYMLFIFPVLDLGLQDPDFVFDFRTRFSLPPECCSPDF